MLKNIKQFILQHLTYFSKSILRFFKKGLNSTFFILIKNLIGLVSWGFTNTFRFIKGYFKSVVSLVDIFLYFFIIPIILIISIIIYGIVGDEELFATTNNEQEDEDIGFTSESSKSSSDDSLAAESKKLSVARRFDSNYQEVMDSYESLDHYSNRANHDAVFIRGNLEFAISSTDFLMSLISEGRLPDRGGTFDRMENIKNRATELLDEFNSRTSSNTNTTNVPDTDNNTTNTSNTDNNNSHIAGPSSTNYTEDFASQSTNNTNTDNVGANTTSTNNNNNSSNNT